MLNNREKEIQLSIESEEYIKQIQGDYSNAVPFYMKDQFSKNNPVTYLLKRSLASPDDLKNMMQKGYHLFTRHHYIKIRGKPIKDSTANGFRYAFTELEGVKKKNSLKEYYAELIKPVNDTVPFLYYPLHYQPENTTCPQGEIFTDQFLIIDMISKVLPENWHLYIKEHTSQWHPLMHGECSRDKHFYEKVRKLPNVSFISTDLSSFELIDKAKAVVTVTGTSGWESILRGAPALVFGHAWYKDCHGVFAIESINDLKQALGLISKGFPIDMNKVCAYIKALENVCIRAYVGEGYKEASNISYEDNVKTMCESIHTFLSELLKNNNTVS
jgi:hypothetical protein